MEVEGLDSWTCADAVTSGCKQSQVLIYRPLYSVSRLHRTSIIQRWLKCDVTPRLWASENPSAVEFLMLWLYADNPFCSIDEECSRRTLLLGVLFFFVFFSVVFSLLKTPVKSEPAPQKGPEAPAHSGSRWIWENRFHRRTVRTDSHGNPSYGTPSWAFPTYPWLLPGSRPAPSWHRSGSYPSNWQEKTQHRVSTRRRSGRAAAEEGEAKSGNRPRKTNRE